MSKIQLDSVMLQMAHPVYKLFIQSPSNPSARGATAALPGAGGMKMTSPFDASQRHSVRFSLSSLFCLIWGMLNTFLY